MTLCSGPKHLDYWQRQRPYPASYVYVIRAGEDSPIKVGLAKDVQARMATLQTGNPRKLRVLYVLPGDLELEWQLHNRLQGQRLVGEWFDGPEIPAFLGFVASLAQRMLQSHRECGELPDYRDFEKWLVRYEKAPVTVRWVEPERQDPEKVNARQREAEEARTRRISEEFAWVQGGNAPLPSPR